MDVDALVIGAGHGGLAVSFHLARLGVHHAVLEAGRIGESWRSQRWDSFVLNSPTSFNRLPGDGPETDPGPDDGFVTGPEWVGYLERYAVDHGLPVRTGVRATGLEVDAAAGPAGRRFRLTVEGAEAGAVRARALVVASGMQRVPTLPPVAAGLPDEVHALHAAAYRRPDGLPPGGVLVVGCAQSGGQIAEELLAAGRRVVVTTGRVPRVPRRYRGQDMFQRLGDSGWWEMTLADLPDPRMAGGAQPSISGVGRYGHTLSFQGLARRGAELTGRLLGFDGGVARFAPDLAESIRFADRTSAAARARIDGWLAAHDPGAPRADIEPDPDDEPVASPEAFPVRTALDLRAEGIASVIWATGFGPDLAWGGPLLSRADGTPRQAGAQGEVPGTWFVGVPWMLARRSGLVVGADADGASVAGAVAAFLRG